MKDFKFIGTVGIDAINKTVGSYPWEFKEMPTIPYPVVNSPKGYIVAAGSACLSLATTSAGITYNSAIDVIRQDLNGVDTDHYVSVPWKKGIFAVFMAPPTEYHHLKPTDSLFSNLSRSWQEAIKDFISDPKKI